MHERLSIYKADLDSHADGQAVTDLLDAYARDPMGLARPLDGRVLREVVHGLRSHPAAVQFLVRAEDGPAAVAVCFAGYSTFSAHPLLNIHDLVVHPRHRRQGVATQLLDAIEVHARQLDCCKLTLEVRADNQVAQALYRKHGFAPGRPVYEFWTKPLA